MLRKVELPSDRSERSLGPDQQDPGMPKSIEHRGSLDGKVLERFQPLGGGKIFQNDAVDQEIGGDGDLSHTSYVDPLVVEMYSSMSRLSR